MKRVSNLAIVSAICGVLLATSLSASPSATADTVPAAPSQIAPGENVTFDTSGSRIEAHDSFFVHNGSTYYRFGSSTAEGRFTGINVYTSTDLVNWSFDKVALPVQSSGYANGTDQGFRPAVVWNASTSQWVMWVGFCTDGTSCAAAHQQYGVATSSTIDGPYTYQGDHLMPSGAGLGDPTLFTDSGGANYLIDDTNNNDLTIYALNSSANAIASTVHAFGFAAEGPSIFLRNGLYYLMDSHLSGWTPNQDFYMTASSLSGPWSAKKVLAPLDGSNTTYSSQTGGVITVAGSAETSYIYAGDRWTQGGAASPNQGKYVWIPISFDDRSGQMSLPALYDTFTINVSTGSWSTTGTVNDSVHGTGNDQWQLSGSGWAEGGGGLGRYAGDNAYSTTANDTDTLRFYGSGVDIYSFADPTTGIFAVSVDGGTETNVDEYATVSQGDQIMYSVRGLSAGVQHTVRVRVTGTKNPLSTGTVVNVDRAVVMPVTLDDTVTGTGTDQFNYGTGWTAGGESDHGGRLNGTSTYTAGPATATMSFIGTRLEFFGVVSGVSGLGSISIDGGAATQIDQYSTGGAVHGNQLEYQSALLTAGTHTVTIQASGTKDATSSGTYFNIDRVNIYG